MFSTLSKTSQILYKQYSALFYGHPRNHGQSLIEVSVTSDVLRWCRPSFSRIILALLYSLMPTGFVSNAYRSGVSTSELRDTVHFFYSPPM